MDQDLNFKQNFKKIIISIQILLTYEEKKSKRNLV